MSMTQTQKLREEAERRQCDPVDLLADNFMKRKRRGESPAVEDYAARFPELAEDIRAVLPALEYLAGSGAGAGSDSAAESGLPLSSNWDGRRVTGPGTSAPSDALDLSSDLGREYALADHRAKPKPEPEPGAPEPGAAVAGFSYLDANTEFGDDFRFETSHPSITGNMRRQGTRVRGNGREIVIDDEALPDYLGENRVIRVLGRGGMGVVYEAEQEMLNRRVAVKVIARHSAFDALSQQRFFREARAIARLQHPHIVPILSVGEQDGMPFYVMPLIEGAGLDKLVNPAPPANFRKHARFVARAGMQIAKALGHAHEKGMLHRDVKPSNILMDREGKVWLTDFGLAKSAGDESLTASTELPGTLRYMAPECFYDQHSERSDQYSLGLTMYELLVGRPAFNGRERLTVLRQIQDVVPVPPRAISPNVPKDLECIILKAMAQDHRVRYESASALADDLQCFLAGLPVKARPLPWWRRGTQAAQRKRLGMIGAFAAMVALIPAIALMFANQITENGATRPITPSSGPQVSAPTPALVSPVSSPNANSNARAAGGAPVGATGNADGGRNLENRGGIAASPPMGRPGEPKKGQGPGQGPGFQGLIPDYLRKSFNPDRPPPPGRRRPGDHGPDGPGFREPPPGHPDGPEPWGPEFGPPDDPEGRGPEGRPRGPEGGRPRGPEGRPGGRPGPGGPGGRPGAGFSQHPAGRGPVMETGSGRPRRMNEHFDL